MDSTQIKQLIETLLKHLHITCEGIEVAESDGRERYSIQTPDSHVLIGAKGAHLSALNHLVKKMVAAKEAGKRTPQKDAGSETSTESPSVRERAFFVDVNGYQEAAVQNIKNIAKIMGDRARSFKSSVELEPMSSYERMIVHSYFQEAKDVKTESSGEGDRRRVVIKYVERREE